MADKRFRILWSKKAIENFKTLFNVDHRKVIRNSEHVLSVNPFRCAYGIANFPGYKFKGYFWMKVNNVILIYRVDADYKLVSIEGCYSALTGEVAEMFYGVSPDDK